ncbi:MAG: hypothetical protein HOW73_08760 [Polyangiaceae bacterium]|nr:hypothetical protein [Polyangiaceae bacterium]
MTLAERFAKLDPRERRLLTGLAITVAALFVVFLPAYLYQSVSAKRDDNQEIRDYIDKVTSSRAKIDRQKAQREQLEARYQKSMPPLSTFIEDAAKANQLEIDESAPKPDVPHGKKYVEKIQALKLRKVGLLALVKTLEKIERSNYPVAITRLNIKPRSEGPDSFDVEAFVSAFERKDGPKKEQPAKDEEEGEEETP